VILYQYPGGAGLASVSPPCLKVWLALRRIGAEHRVVDCGPNQARRVSRTGRLPVLELDDGTRVPESVTILDALEERFPEADLFPRDPVERTRDRLWDHYGTDVIYWFGFFFRWVNPDTAQRTFRAFFGRMPLPARLAIRATFFRTARRRARLHGVGGLGLETVERAIDRAFETIETGLEGGPFLGGRQAPGRGDLSCAALLAQIGFRDTMPRIEARFRGHPALSRHSVAVFEACGVEPPAWLRF
jgi:glutathione S-transferase